MSRLCLCLTASTREGMQKQIERYESDFDMLEFRLDLLDSAERLGVFSLASCRNEPKILTIRLEEDGGQWGVRSESEEERSSMMVGLIQKGCWDWVDLEYGRSLPRVEKAARDSKTGIIRSMHDFQGTLLDRPLDELQDLISQMGQNGAVPKLAVYCRNSRDLLKVVQLSAACREIKEKVILGMGEYGFPTRVLAGRLGAGWTYSSSADKDSPLAAPGQCDPHTLQQLYRFKDIDGDTPIYGIVGNPVAHSRSPVIHNRWLRRDGRTGCYIAIRLDDPANMLPLCDALGIQGLSVTVPYKEYALGISHQSDEVTKKIGSANTLIRTGGGWQAHNTDAPGFLLSLLNALGLESQDQLHGMHALVIGAGGAARAAVYALSVNSVRLTIVNRSAEKARRLAGEVGAGWGTLSEESRDLLDQPFDFAVQTTSAGMSPFEDAEPLPWWNPSRCRLVYDMIYKPEKTLFLRRAESQGVPVCNGASMLSEQAGLQYRLWP